jgi:hypothetical protein
MPATRFNRGDAPSKRIVPYLDLSGGLNTADDDHALARNELAVSINTWYPYGKSLGKRPGSVPFAGGVTGASAACTGIASARFNGITYVVVQVGTALYAAKESDTVFTPIGTMSTGAKSISAAEMFEPNSGKDTLFIVNGVDYPLVWQGPGTTVVPASTLPTPNLPLNYTGTGVITPSLVTTYQNFLLYSGEPTKPTAVYVSNPEFPNNFTNPTSVNPTGSDPNYNPYVVGANDGVNGGSITQIATLEQGVIIFKEAAIYSFILTGLYNDIIFYPQLISASIGCSATHSVARFDGFLTFLGIDGVYTVTIANGANQISKKVPTYFDSSLTGDVALITNRISAVGVRHGGRYLLFYTNIYTTPRINASGMWFDFTRPDAQGIPSSGEISGMSVAGAVSLRGLLDDGNVVFCDSGQDRVGKFGVGFSDPNPDAAGFGAPITLTFAGKSDFMDDVFTGDGSLRPKTISKAWLVLSLGGHTPTIDFSGTLTFHFTWIGGLANPELTSSGSVSLAGVSQNDTWGENWGSFVWAGDSSNQPYVIIEADIPGGAQANNVQMRFVESSNDAYVITGFFVEVLDRQPQQGSYEKI